MKFRVDISHEDEVGGIVYRLVRSDSDVEAVRDMFVAVMLSGRILECLCRVASIVLPPPRVEEPVTKSKGGYDPHNLPPSLVSQAEEIIAHGVSVAAVDASTGRVVGMRTAHIIDRYRRGPRQAATVS